jgi:alpha-D-xyloside xylohydrolase
MKFSDGNWMMRDGVSVAYATEGYEIEQTDDSLTLHAATRPIRHRGDTLQGPLLSVRYSSPLPDVIRVQVAHFTGAAPGGPHFPLTDVAPPIQTSANDESAQLNSGALSVEIDRKEWTARFTADGKTITRSPARGLGYATVAGEGNYLHEQLCLGVGECVYGLGERFTALVKNGQIVDTWNKDGGTGSDQAYKNVPFYLTNRGYGVFVNHSENVSFEVASEKVSRVQFSVPGETLDYFVIYGPTPKEILARYTALTGRAALPPAWSFGLWLTTSFTTRYDEPAVTKILDEMAARDLPLHVFHFDCFWMREFHWCNFEWDARTFPDPAGMLRRLHERGLKVSVWINPYIAQRSRLFAEAVSNGYLLRRANGDVYQTDQWQPGMGIVDFTNPEACRWFADHLRILADGGVDCLKTDFGERIPLDVLYADGSDPAKMHNFYAYLYNKVVFDALESQRGKGDAVVFARSATAGCQQFPVHWGGDCSSNYESMAESLRGGLSLGLSGFGFWSHDIGGFEGKPPADIYKRWIAFGLLSSHSRLHGSSSYRVPWEFDDESVDVLRFFTGLKCRLMPYLFAQAVEARQSGLPVMRAMLLEFPDDPTSDFLDRQYLLGDSLLVAPIFRPDGLAEYYVPAGRWTHFLTGDSVVGPRWVREIHDYQSLPLLVRPNTIIAVGANSRRPDYDFAEGVTFRIYEPEAGATLTTTVPDLAGAPRRTATAQRDGDRVRVTVDGPSDAPWSVDVFGEWGVRSAEGVTGRTVEIGLE